MTTTQAHALYRFYDATGTLLYIGITLDPGSRWRSHAQDKPWWHDVADIRLELHPDRDSVLEAERAAIIAEHPLHNVVHNRRRRPPRPTPARRLNHPKLPRSSHPTVIHLFAKHSICLNNHGRVEPNAGGALECCDCGHLIYGCPCTRIQEVAFS